VASGTLSNGDTIIVNSDGTVSAVAGSSASVGSESTFETRTIYYSAAVFDSSNNKVVIAFRDEGNSAYGTAVVGTVSGTSISFGSPVIFVSRGINPPAITYDSSNNKVVIAYYDYGLDDGKAVVGTVSGTSISFGSIATFDSVGGDEPAITFDSNSNKVVIAWRDSGTSSRGTAVVGTVSGTSISFGSNYIFNGTYTEHISLAFDSSNNKVVVAYVVNSTGVGQSAVGTISGTSISFGSAVVFESGAGVQHTKTVFDTSTNKIVIAYRDGAVSGYGTAIVGTVSGTTISFGTKAVFNSANTNQIGATFDTAQNKTVIVYRDAGDTNNGEVVTGTVSGTSISFDPFATFNPANSYGNTAAFDSNAGKTVIAFTDGGNSGYGTAVVFTAGSTNLTSDNFIGFADSGYVNGQNVGVDSTCSINSDQTGLTAGQKYYVQSDGSLSETAGDPSVLAGTAISATKILVKG
jgi:hypothetical protein